MNYALLDLQRSAGNRAVGALLQTGRVASNGLPRFGAPACPPSGGQNHTITGASDVILTSRRILSARSLVQLPAVTAGPGGGHVAGLVDLPYHQEPMVEEKSAEGTPVRAAAQTASIWAAQARTPVQLAEGLWAALQPPKGSARSGAAAIAGPTVAPLDKIQNVGFFDAQRLGATTLPNGTSKAPAFDFNTSSKKDAKGVTQWYAMPKLTQAAYEGDSVCWFVAAGIHKTTLVEAKAPVYWEVSAAMSGLDADAEGEHSSDIKWAYKISLKEAERVLKANVVGKLFGPKGTEADVKQQALDTIQANVAEPKLGSDQTKWNTIYSDLYGKTFGRDNKGWHTFGLANRYTNKAGDVIYKVNKGTTKINVVDSKKLIKY